MLPWILLGGGSTRFARLDTNKELSDDSNAANRSAFRRCSGGLAGAAPCGVRRQRLSRQLRAIVLAGQLKLRRRSHGRRHYAGTACRLPGARSWQCPVIGRREHGLAPT